MIEKTEYLCIIKEKILSGRLYHQMLRFYIHKDTSRTCHLDSKTGIIALTQHSDFVFGYTESIDIQNKFYFITQSKLDEVVDWCKRNGIKQQNTSVDILKNRYNGWYNSFNVFVVNSEEDLMACKLCWHNESDKSIKIFKDFN